MAPLVALVMLASCTRAPQIYLLNNSGVTVWVKAAEGDGDPNTSERYDGLFGLAWVRDQRGKAVMWSRQSPARLELSIRGCQSVYVIPDTGARTNESVVLQLEADSRLYLVDAGTFEIERFERPVALGAQPEGFPIAPQAACAPSAQAAE